MVKKILKITGKILLIILAAFVMLTVGLFVSNKVQLAREEKMLAEKGYLNRVSVGDYRLNVCSYGSDAPKHTVVGISGKGVHNYSAAMRGVTDHLADDNKIVFVDRAGYGLSDDTTVPQTTERIVEDYRAALKNAGFEAPYVLMPHSLGGIYTTYWLSKYPEEIEGVVLLDCTQLSDDEKPFDYTTGPLDYIEVVMCRLGYQRPLFRFFDAEAFFEVPDELSDVNNALIYNKAYTFAMVSENKLINENCCAAYNSIVSTDIPKIYIANHQQTAEDIDEMIDIMNGLKRKTGGKEFSPPADKEALLTGLQEFFDTVTYPYIQSLGNCDVKYVNGTHMLYVHKPDETADIIEEFLERLDK